MRHADLDAVQIWYLTEALTAAVIENYVQPDMVVLDLGANRGLHTARLARRVGPGGKVHAFEPNPVHFPVLSGIPHTRLWPFAVGDTLRLAQLHVPRREDGWASLAVQPWWGGATEHDRIDTVEVRLDDLGEIADESIAFVKLDVEGHESAALRGMATTLRRCQPLVVLENPDSFAWAFLHDQEFTLFRLDESSDDEPELPLANRVAVPQRCFERRSELLPNPAQLARAVQNAGRRAFEF